MGFLTDLFSRFARKSKNELQADCRSIDDIVTIVEIVTEDYYEANGYGTFKADILVTLGLDQQLEDRFRRGEQPRIPLDNILISMIENNSLRGVQICIEAGADPLKIMNSYAGNHTGISLAEALERDKMFELMTSYVVTPIYKQRMALRQVNNGQTTYMPDFHLI